MGMHVYSGRVGAVTETGGQSTLHDVTIQLLSRGAIEAERANAASELSRQ